ncbi:hypothetical protein [Sinosporangium siamense]|uniref:CU044_5270 family protein n=1 Tax=Sinosporangium siamense TaxID=1367973 RepID=A0A919RNI8_9ACTN|nr:hypothetical protein [Sinosporangium siamense]GII95729.1 hypothetical protein Ssi02_59600 [Sinosporangium siamense]
MDELDLLARALPDANPPSPDVVARARARLAASPARPARRRTRTWTLTAAAATVGTVGIVGVVFGLVANLTAAAPSAVAPKRNQALLDLADRIEGLPAETGSFWRQTSIRGQYVKRSGITYVGQLHSETWQPRDFGEPATQLFWPNPIARPATTADERAWRAAGSPRRVKFPCDEGERCDVPVTDKVGQCEHRTLDNSRVDGTVGDLTMADLAALPTGQKELKEKLRTYHRVWEKRGFKQPFNEYLATTSNLLELPLRPDQRAAVIRLLAGLPATKVIGTVTDPLNRPALSVEFGTPNNTLVYNRKTGLELPVYHRMHIDPTTGTTLADVSHAARAGVGMAKDSVVTFRATTSESGWTTEQPTIPKGCKKSKNRS